MIFYPCFQISPTLLFQGKKTEENKEKEGWGSSLSWRKTYCSYYIFFLYLRCPVIWLIIYIPGKVLDFLPFFSQISRKNFWVLSGIGFPEMGNRLICLSKKDSKDNGSRSKRVNRSQRKLLADEDFLHRQALSMALHQHQLSQRFDGSMSRRIGSTSSRRHNISDSVSNGKQVGTDFLPKTISSTFSFFYYFSQQKHQLFEFDVLFIWLDLL